MSNKEVALKLFLSEKTISAHKHNILSKLGISAISEINEHDMTMGEPRQSHGMN